MRDEEYIKFAKSCRTSEDDYRYYQAAEAAARKKQAQGLADFLIGRAIAAAVVLVVILATGAIGIYASTRTISPPDVCWGECVESEK